ncbi:MAG: hypothetical protein ACXADH_12735 [Candidatus Kariarchaeaceae archaeon]|jgi:rubredoxin
MIEEINGRWTCTDCGYEWSACMGDDEVPEECECKYEEIEVTVKVSPFQIEALEKLSDWWFKTATPATSGGDQSHSDFVNHLKNDLKEQLDKTLKPVIVVEAKEKT